MQIDIGDQLQSLIHARARPKTQVAESLALFAVAALASAAIIGLYFSRKDGGWVPPEALWRKVRDRPTIH